MAAGMERLAALQSVVAVLRDEAGLVDSTQRDSSRTLRPTFSMGDDAAILAAAGAAPSAAARVRVREKHIYAVQGAHLNPLGLFLCTSTPFIWRILSACLPS